VSRAAGGSEYDAIVVGLGGIGSAAAYRLARRRGARVLGLEQFELGHGRGASQDVSRIIRLSYHRREYVELAKQAYRAWSELEAEAGEQVVTITGGLDLAPPLCAESIDDYAEAMSVAGVAFEWLDETEVIRRWPQWRPGEGTRAIFQARAGIVDPSRGNAAHQRLAREHGARLLEHTRVSVIREQGGELEVTTDDGRRYTAGAVVLAADAWTNQLLAGLGCQLRLSVTLEQVAWFESAGAADGATFDAERFPIWIWLDLPSFYGFPAHAGRGPKVGQDLGGPQTTADTRTFEPDPGALARVQAFADSRLGGRLGRPVEVKTCLYTLTPDRDFVLDRLPQAPGVVVALGAAHGYKFAALFGELLAELALDGQRTPLRPELSLFSIDRPALSAAAAT
jgi:sarcosine oxidase